MQTLAAKWVTRVGFEKAKCRVERWRGSLDGTYLLPALSFAGASIAPPCSGRDRSVARMAAGDGLSVSAFPLYVPV